MRSIVIAMLLTSCASEEPRRVPQSRAPVPIARTAIAVAAPDPREATRRAAHDMLAEYCGECHEGHRSTVAKALAVFDLDKPDWPARFDDHRYQAALMRLANKPPAAREAFIAFRDAELASMKSDPI